MNEIPLPKDIHVAADLSPDGRLEPLAVIVEGERFDVLGTADRWDDADAKYFKVRAADGRQYLLKWDATDQRWSVERAWQLDA